MRSVIMRYIRKVLIMACMLSASMSIAHAQGNLNGVFGVKPLLTQKCTYTSQEQTEWLLDRLVALNLVDWSKKNCNPDLLSRVDAGKMRDMEAFYGRLVRECYSKKDAEKIFTAIRQPKKGLACSHPVVEQTVADVRKWLRAKSE
jgi:hypothetical protein